MSSTGPGEAGVPGQAGVPGEAGGGAEAGGGRPRFWPFQGWGSSASTPSPPPPATPPPAPPPAPTAPLPAAPPPRPGRVPPWKRPADRRFVRIAAIALAAAVVIAGALVYVISHPSGSTISAVFTEATGVYPGSDVRILGVKVGKIDSVQPSGTHVVVTMTIDHGISIPASADAVVVAPSVVADRYVQLTPPYTGGPSLASGAVIPLGRTAVPVEIDQVYSAIANLTHALGPNGVNKHGALTDLLNVSAANLAGNGQNLGTMINRFGQALRTLSGSQSNFFGTIDNLQMFTTMLKTNDSGVRLAEQQLAQVAGFLAADRQNLAGALHELSIALGQVQQFIQSNRAALKSNIGRLMSLTQLLVNQRASLAEALDTTPLALDNVLNAYDPATGTLDARGNLQEISSGKCSFITNPLQTGCPSSSTGAASGQSNSSLPLPALGNGTVPGASR